MLTAELIKSFILTTSLSLGKREVGVSLITLFTNIGKDAVDKLSNEEDVNGLLIMTGKLLNSYSTNMKGHI